MKSFTPSVSSNRRISTTATPIMGIGFTKLLQGQMPNQHAITARVYEVAAHGFGRIRSRMKKAGGRERFPELAVCFRHWQILRVIAASR
jgi:hypothetical protein